MSSKVTAIDEADGNTRANAEAAVSGVSGCGRVENELKEKHELRLDTVTGTSRSCDIAISRTQRRALSCRASMDRSFAAANTSNCNKA